MYNRYRGNSGHCERVDDHPLPPPPPPPPRPRPPKAPEPSRPPPPGGRELGRLLQKLSPGRLEPEDWMVLLLLYLLYRESGDVEFLFMLGAFLIL